MNRTINPPIKTKNKIKENQEFAIINQRIKQIMRACALIRAIIIIGWAEYPKETEIKAEASISILISGYRI